MHGWKHAREDIIWYKAGWEAILATQNVGHHWDIIGIVNNTTKLCEAGGRGNCGQG